MRPSPALWRAATRWKLRQLPCLVLPHSITVGTDPFSLLLIPTQVLPQSKFSAPAKIDEALQSRASVRGPSFECFQQPRWNFLSCGDGDEDTGLSRQHRETRVIGYSPEQLFDVVAAVDLYEDFVPWCQKSSVLWRKGEETLDAELEVGFKFFIERYISHVELKQPTLIKTSVSQSSLFDYLINVWEFKPGPVPGSCELHFLVDFQFRSPLYRQVANMFFNEVVSRLVSSFENRCNTVYGPGVKITDNTYSSQAA